MTGGPASTPGVPRRKPSPNQILPGLRRSRGRGFPDLRDGFAVA